MASWVENTHAKAVIIHDQIAAARRIQEETGADTSDLIDGYMGLLEELYEDGFPLSRILDTSDIVLHAEGPTTVDHRPSLNAINWICGETEKQLRRLAKNIFDLSERDATKLARALDLRLSGFAPGSIYAGFSIQKPKGDLFEGDNEPVFVALKEAVNIIPMIPEYIGDDSLSIGISEILPDPATRDAELSMAMSLSPTGRRGIHTLEISTPGRNMASFSQRERVVLRDALKRPEMINTKRGTFTGEVREMDLDAGRFHLRNIPTIGTLRCVSDQIKSNWLGAQIRVTGDYASDRSGKPRLMNVDTIDVITPPEQLTLN